MANNRLDDDVKQAKKINKPLNRLNDLFSKTMDTLSNSNSNRDDELRKLEAEIDNVIYDEIQTITKFTGEDISTFMVKLFNDDDRNNAGTSKDIEDIFSSENAGIFSFFQERYRNRNLLYDDLNTIASQLPELREAINATRDAIVTSDDMTKDVSHTINLKNASLSDDEKRSVVDAVTNIAKKFELLQRLKDHIIPKTLEYGTYYVYSIPYAKLFQKHYDKKIKSENGMQETTESFAEYNFRSMFKTLENIDDNFVKDFVKNNSIQGGTVTESRELKNLFNGVLDNVEIGIEDDTPIPMLENTDLTPLLGKFEDTVKQIVKKQEKESAKPFSDGTAEIKSEGSKDFSNINIEDCYIKLIEPRKMIQIKILDQVIGYYYIHQEEIQGSHSPFTTTIKTSNMKIGDGLMDGKDLETSFLTKITDKIVKSFDKKFLETNIKFKELILNSLIYNDIYKKKIRFQFIPVDYITEFKVNKDEEGNGTSTLMPSLFYAKLYLSILIFKIISIMSRSNDTRIFYVKNSGIDMNTANKIQGVAREIKARQINFQDLLNYNSMIAKIGAAKDIFMPTGRGDIKGIDFDVMAGQNIELNTELMDLLKRGFINATGVPSVIMDYIDQADYAKTLVMANAKFLARVVNDQLDFNASMTELYRKVVAFSTQLEPEIINAIEFALNAPKTLNITNMTDLLSNADQVIQFMIKAMTGENSSPDDDDNKVKDILYNSLAREILPMLPWKMSDEALKDARLKLLEVKKQKEQMSNTQETS